MFARTVAMLRSRGFSAPTVYLKRTYKNNFASKVKAQAFVKKSSSFVAKPKQQVASFKKQAAVKPVKKVQQQPQQAAFAKKSGFAAAKKSGFAAAKKVPFAASKPKFSVKRAGSKKRYNKFSAAAAAAAKKNATNKKLAVVKKSNQNAHVVGKKVFGKKAFVKKVAAVVNKSKVSAAKPALRNRFARHQKRRNVSGYNVFLRANGSAAYARLRRAVRDPKKRFITVGRSLAKQWRSLSASQRRQYAKQAQRK